MHFLPSPGQLYSVGVVQLDPMALERELPIG